MRGALPRTREATPEEWDEHWSGCDHATYFHSRGWSETWSTYTDGRLQPSPILLTFDDGTEAVLPLTEEDTYKGLGTRYEASPAGTYGGWISADGLTSEQARAATATLFDLDEIHWRRNPFEPPSSVPRTPTTEDTTQAVDLTPAFEDVHAAWDKSHRYNARKTRREGVEVFQAETTEHWRAYYEVYEACLERWGEDATSEYGWRLFETLHGRQDPAVRLWLARYQDEVIGGALCLYAPDHVSYWHGANLRKHSGVYPSNLILYEAMQDACQRGLSWFDMNPSGGHEGVRRFKSRFSPEVLEAPVYTTESALSQAAAPVERLVASVKAKGK